MRTISVLAIELILHIHARGSRIPNEFATAQADLLQNFLADGLTQRDFCRNSGYRTTPKGDEWVARLKATLPPRAYGASSMGFYIIGKDEPAFKTIELARAEAMYKHKTANLWKGQFPGYLKAAYILKAIELIEPTQPEYKTTYLS